MAPACLSVSTSSGLKPHVFEGGVGVGAGGNGRALHRARGAAEPGGGGGLGRAVDVDERGARRRCAGARAPASSTGSARSTPRGPRRTSTHSALVRVRISAAIRVLQRRPLRTVHLAGRVDVVEAERREERAAGSRRTSARTTRSTRTRRRTSRTRCRSARRRRAGWCRAGPTAHRVEPEEDAHQLRAAVDHRGVDHLALARRRALDERGEDAHARRASRRRRSRRAG